MTNIGIALFLGFLGSLWAVLRSAEGAPARGSVIAVAGAVAGAVSGAIVGVAVNLQGFVFQDEEAPVGDETSSG